MLIFALAKFFIRTWECIVQERAVHFFYKCLFVYYKKF